MEDIFGIRMRTVIFDNEISRESIIDLIDRLEEIKEAEKILLYFYTNGGNVNYINILIDYLNKRNEYITIKFFNELASAGTDLLLKFKGKVLFDKSLEFMIFHVGNKYVPLSKKNNVDPEILSKYYKEDVAEYIEFLKNLDFFSEKELDNISNNIDVIVYRENFELLVNKIHKSN